MRDVPVMTAHTGQVTDFADELALLTGPDAIGLLWAAAMGTQAALPSGLTAELIDLHYRPGSEVTALYELSDGSDTDYLAATTAEVDGRVATASGEGMTLRVWRHPDDPRLPGLAPACDAEVVSSWLDDLGVPPGDDLEVVTLGYRPLRRAVLRAARSGYNYYLKVVRPSRAERLVRRQSMLSDAGLTAPVAARPADGVVITAEIAGRCLNDCLAEGDAPPFADIVAMLRRLPEAVLNLPARATWPETLGFHTATALQQLPAERDRIERTSARIAALLADAPTGPIVPAHGDCYEANIFITPGGPQLIDVDSLGPGLLVDDLACLLGHLAVLPDYDPRYAQVGKVLEAWRVEAEALVDPVALCARIAAVVLSLIAGADNTQAQKWLAIAESWATRVDPGKSPS
jgi:hypothetical protein